MKKFFVRDADGEEYEVEEVEELRDEDEVATETTETTETIALTEDEIKELAYKCSFMNTRTIGQFKVLTIGDMENIYRAAK